MAGVYVCPFCKTTYTIPKNLLITASDAVIDVAALSIECPCGATYAVVRGGRAWQERDGN